VYKSPYINLSQAREYFESGEDLLHAIQERKIKILGRLVADYTIDDEPSGAPVHISVDAFYDGDLDVQANKLHHPYKAPEGFGENYSIYVELQLDRSSIEALSKQFGQPKRGRPDKFPWSEIKEYAAELALNWSGSQNSFMLEIAEWYSKYYDTDEAPAHCTLTRRLGNTFKINQQLGSSPSGA
jgi:hypothetical protein